MRSGLSWRPRVGRGPERQSCCSRQVSAARSRTGGGSQDREKGVVMAVQSNRSGATNGGSNERSRGVSLAPVGHRVVNFLRGPKIQDDGYDYEQPTGLIEDERWSEPE